MTRVTRRTPTCATCRNKHACTLFRLSRHSHWFITLHMAQDRSHLSFTPSPISSMMCGCLWVFSTSPSTSPCFFLLPLPVLLLDVRLWRWLRDKQPAQLRQRDLRHPGRLPPTHMICCYQVTTIFCTRYGSAIASSARGLCNFGPLAGLATSVFREMSINTVFTQILHVSKA